MWHLTHQSCPSGMSLHLRKPSANYTIGRSHGGYTRKVAAAFTVTTATVNVPAATNNNSCCALEQSAKPTTGAVVLVRGNNWASIVEATVKSLKPNGLPVTDEGLVT